MSSQIPSNSETIYCLFHCDLTVNDIQTQAKRMLICPETLIVGLNGFSEDMSMSCLSRLASELGLTVLKETMDSDDQNPYHLSDFRFSSAIIPTAFTLPWFLSIKQSIFVRKKSFSQEDLYLALRKKEAVMFLNYFLGVLHFKKPIVTPKEAFSIISQGALQSQNEIQLADSIRKVVPMSKIGRELWARKKVGSAIFSSETIGWLGVSSDWGYQKILNKITSQLEFLNNSLANALGD